MPSTNAVGSMRSGSVVVILLSAGTSGLWPVRFTGHSGDPIQRRSEGARPRDQPRTNAAGHAALAGDPQVTRGVRGGNQGRLARRVLRTSAGTATGSGPVL